MALATPWISVIPGQIGGIDATELWRRIRSIRTQHYMPIVCVVAADLNSAAGDPIDPHAVFDVVFHLDRGVTALTAEVMRLIRLAGEVRGYPGFERKATSAYAPAFPDIDRLPKRPPEGGST